VARFDISDRLSGNAAIYRQAMDLYQQRNYHQAVGLLEQLAAKPSLQGLLTRYYLSRAHRFIAQELMEKSDCSGAICHLKAALKANANSPTLVDFLATALATNQDYQAAAQQYTLLGRLEPGKGKTKLKLALSNYLAGKTDSACRILKEFLTGEPGDFQANYFLGLILAGQEQYQSAQNYLIQACKLKGQNCQAHLQLGMTYAANSQFDRALEALQQVHRLDPANHYIALQIALATQAARQQGQLVTIKLLPPAQPQQQEQKHSQAIDHLAELIAGEPQFVQAFLDLPKSQMDQQIFAQLLEILLKATQNNPQYADHWLLSSKIHQRLGQLSPAIEASKRALQINPQFVKALILLGQLYIQGDRHGLAIDRLRQAIKLGCNYADVHYMLGNLYRGQGFVQKARNHYHKALQINNNFQAARQALHALAA